LKIFSTPSFVVDRFISLGAAFVADWGRCSSAPGVPPCLSCDNACCSQRPGVRSDCRGLHCLEQRAMHWMASEVKLWKVPAEATIWKHLPKADVVAASVKACTESLTRPLELGAEAYIAWSSVQCIGWPLDIGFPGPPLHSQGFNRSKAGVSYRRHRYSLLPGCISGGRRGPHHAPF
jgi:hypothetical protein